MIRPCDFNQSGKPIAASANGIRVGNEMKVVLLFSP